MWRLALPFILLTAPGTVGAAAFVKADRQLDTYLLLQEALGGIPYEVPDCGHSSFGPHITQERDTELGRDVFVLHLHAKEDNDRCLRIDRQRTEIKTYPHAPNNLGATEGARNTFRWKFRLPENFVAGDWTHIFQIKASSNSHGNPLLALTLDGSSSPQLRLLHAPEGKFRELFSVPADPFLGEWVEAYLHADFSNNGSMVLEMRRVHGNEFLLEANFTDLDLWRDDSDYLRPKWGIYRSLKSPALKNETIKLVDICYATDGDPCRPPAPPTFVVEAPGEIKPTVWLPRQNLNILPRMSHDFGDKAPKDRSNGYFRNVLARLYSLLNSSQELNSCITRETYKSCTKQPQ